MWKDTRIVLLVSGTRRAPKALDLGRPRVRWALLGLVLALMLLCTGLGVGVTLVISRSHHRLLAEVMRLHQRSSEQQSQLDHVRKDAGRQLDALAVRLGQLQAQSTRINALGERLVQLGKLDKKEFNFNQTPPLGGVEEDTSSNDHTPFRSLDNSIDQLAAQFDAQQAQLSVLQSMLMNARIDSSMKPAGMPVWKHCYISSYFGPRRDPFDGHLEFHPGLDVAAPVGTPIHAVASGVVVFSGKHSGYGKMVEINHGNGYATRYAHDSKLLVHVGEQVKVGQVIARIGSTGRSTGPHVHFEVRYKGRALNPLPYVRSHH